MATTGIFPVLSRAGIVANRTTKAGAFMERRGATGGNRSQTGPAPKRPSIGEGAASPPRGRVSAVRSG
jgi:hypothetical protein